jgi:LemA protein
LELIVLLVVVGAIALFVIGIYNGLIGRRNRVDEALSQIQVQLKRRHDLIPNLVETVKGYAAHEKDTLSAVIAARNQAVSAGGDPARSSMAEGQLSGALRQLFAVAEAYPDLKANTNFLQLQGELTNTENQIGNFRQGYNSTAQQYNTRLLSFPTNLIAGPFGFQAQPFFEIQDAAQREAPVVKF